MYNTTHVGSNNVKVTPMTRGEYSEYRGWASPTSERYNDEGYMMEYASRLAEESNVKGYEGYILWTPKQIFEDIYPPNVHSTLSFELALELAKQSRSITQKDWNSGGLKVASRQPTESSDITLPYLYTQYPAASDNISPGHLNALNASVPQLASQSELRSSDWNIVEEH
jgi:hypothetical protein